MNEKEILDEIDKAVYLLCQNKEVKAIETVGNLLGVFRMMMELQTEQQIAEGGMFALLMVRELLEAYQEQDMLGMADCLMEKAVIWTQFFFQGKT